MLGRLLAFVVVVSLSTSARAVTPAEGELLTTMVATAASNDPRVDVLTMADLQKAVALAADRQLVDCRAAEACLAEVAAAMDAAAVLHGKVGMLGEQVVMNLSLFDTKTSTAVGRATATGRDVGALAGSLDASVVRVLERLPPTTAGQRVRVLVMNIDLAGAHASDGGAVADEPKPPAPAAGPPAGPSVWASWPAWTGAGLLAVSAVGLGVGAYSYDAARNAHAEGDAAPIAFPASDAYRARNEWVGVMLASAGVSAVGALSGTGLLLYAYAE